jgi:hypothetical protein
MSFINNLGSSLSDHSSNSSRNSSGHSLGGSSGSFHDTHSSHHAEPVHPEPEPSAIAGRMSRFGGVGHMLRSRSGKILGQVTASGRVLGRWGKQLGRIGSRGNIYMRGVTNPVGKVGSRGQLSQRSIGRVHASEFHNDSKLAFMSIFKKK